MVTLGLHLSADIRLGGEVPLKKGATLRVRHVGLVMMDGAIFEIFACETNFRKNHYFPF